MKAYREALNGCLISLTDGLYSIAEFSEEQISEVKSQGFDPEGAAFQLVYVGVYV